MIYADYVFVQCLLLLEEVPEVLTDDDIQLMLHSAAADVCDCSQSLEHDGIGPTATNGAKTCLRLLCLMFDRAVFALTLNK